MHWGRRWLVGSIAGKAELVLFDWFNNTGGIDMKMDGSFLEGKSSLRMLDCLSFQNWIGAPTLSLLLKLPRRKLDPLFSL